MEILILTANNDFLGKFEQENVKLLQSMGCGVHYAANMNEPRYISDEPKIQNSGVKTHHIDIARSPFMFKNNKLALKQIIDIIRKNNIRIIHCHTPVGGVLGRLAGKFFKDWNLYIIYTAHGFHFYNGAPAFNNIVFYRVEKKLAEYTNVLIVINKEDYKNALKFKLRPNGRIHMIPGVGLNRDIFSPLTEQQIKKSRNRLGVKNDDFFMVSIGELNDNKNHITVLNALKKMRDTGQDISGIKYGVCGDGFLKQRLQQEIYRMKLEDSVTLFGHCFNIPEILGCADAAVLPSKREGLGMAGLEALAMGIPLIASDNRGTREYMRHMRNGFVCRYDDIAGFINGIQTIKNMPEQKMLKMKKYCVKSVQRFDRSHTAAVMKKIYSEALRRISGNE